MTTSEYRHRCWVPGCVVCDPTADGAEPFEPGALVWVQGYYQEQPAEVMRFECGAVLVRGFGWFDPRELSLTPWEGT